MSSTDSPPPETASCHTDHGPIHTEINTIDTNNASTNIIPIHHSVIIVDGRVPNITRECSCTKVLIQHLHRSETIGTTTENLSERPAGLFKTLLELQPGENTLLFTFCNASTAPHRVSLTYSPPALAPLWHETPAVRVLYAVPERYGDLTSAAVGENLTRCMLLVRLAQALFAHKLDGCTFRLEPECRPLRLREPLPAAGLSNEQLWQSVAGEVVRAQIKRKRSGGAGGSSDGEEEIDEIGKRIKYVVIAEDHDTLTGVGGHAVCVLGVPSMAFWPLCVADVAEALNATHLERDGVPYGENYACCSGRTASEEPRRRAAGAQQTAYASVVGALCHEMGHVFGAGHTADGIMSGDIDRVGRVFRVDAPKVFGPRRSAAPPPEEEECALDMRLTKVRQASAADGDASGGGLQLLHQYHEQRDAGADLTWFSPCSRAVLLESRWIRSDVVHVNRATHAADAEQVFSVNDAKRMVCALTAPLRMVELRGRNGLMLAWWRFRPTDERRVFQVPTGPQRDGNNCGGCDVNEAVWSSEELTDILCVDATGLMEMRNVQAMRQGEA